MVYVNKFMRQVIEHKCQRKVRMFMVHTKFTTYNTKFRAAYFVNKYD